MRSWHCRGVCGKLRSKRMRGALAEMVDERAARYNPDPLNQHH